MKLSKKLKADRDALAKPGQVMSNSTAAAILNGYLETLEGAGGAGESMDPRILQALNMAWQALVALIDMGDKRPIY